MKASSVIELAASQVGVHESPANSNNVKYNTWYYGKEVSGANYPWCAVFISWLFRGNQSLCIKTASCAEMLSWFEKRGQTVRSPMPGDIVFFKYSTNTRRTNHVGIIEKVNGNTLHTIEGNTSLTSNDNGGKVMRRKRTKNIVSYARPAYEADDHVKTVDELAKEVIAGKWGSGNDRRQRLIKAGYDYRAVQDKVNQILKGGS